MVHQLVKIEEQTGNFPQYRWYVECSCGFQARLANETAVQGQYNSHLAYHGCEPVQFNSVEVVPDAMPEQVPTP